MTAAAEDAFEQDAQEQMRDEAPRAAKVIKYDYMKGIESERTISTADFKKSGIEQKTVSWNKDNNFMLDAAGFSEAAIELILAQPNFKLLDA